MSAASRCAARGGDGRRTVQAAGRGARPSRGAPARAALLSLLGVLLWAPLAASADALAVLPEAWQERLTAVPEADISGAERVAREAITRTRARLDAALGDPAYDPAELAEGYGELAALYQLFGVDAPAALAWDNARRLQPQDYRWSYHAGYLALIRGDTAAALPLLEAARRLNPDYAPLDLRLGQLWLETNRPQQAREALERAAAQPGLRAAALYHLGQLDLLERDYAGARQRLEEALALDPEASGVHYPLAQALRHLGEEQLAREHLARFKPGAPRADDHLVADLETVLQTSRSDFRRGLKAVEERDYEAAIAHFRAGLEIAPDNLAARVSYARALYLAGQHAAAAEQLSEVLARDPEHVLANFLMGVLQEARGDTERAAERYRSILKRDAEHAGAHFYLGNLLFRGRRFGAAAKHYSAALAASSDIPPARVLELAALQRAGEPDAELAAELERRIQTHPGQPELKYALIRLRSLSSDDAVRDSVRALGLANSLAPANPTPPNVAALALAAAANGQFEQAARLQQQALAGLGWGATEAQQAMQEAALEAYEAGRMPKQAVWPEDDPLLSPPPLNPLDAFLHYPAAVPY